MRYYIDRYEAKGSNFFIDEKKMLFTIDAADLVEFCEQYDTQRDVKRASSIRNDSRDWAGTKTYAEAVKLFQGGDKSLIKHIPDEMLVENAQQAVPVFDVTGEMLDVGMFMSGEPECFHSEMMQPADDKIIRIGFNPAVHAGVEAAQVKAVGAGLIAAVQSLENAGYELHLDAIDCSRSHKHFHLCNIITLKKAGEVMDRQQVLFAAAQPAFSRRFGFRLSEMLVGAGSNSNIYGFGGSYGGVTSYKRYQNLLEQAGIEYDAVIEANEMRTFTAAQVRDAVIEKVEMTEII